MRRQAAALASMRAMPMRAMPAQTKALATKGAVRPAGACHTTAAAVCALVPAAGWGFRTRWFGGGGHQNYGSLAGHAAALLGVP